MNVLITGGTGFIGSRLAIAYLERGDAVRILGQTNTPAEERNMQLLQEKGAQLVLASVNEKDKLRDALQDVDYVFHFAAAQHEMNVPDVHFYKVNVEGTRNMLEASIAAGVKRFVHGSTIGVYGAALDGTLDEKSPVRPDNIYGVTKLDGETLVRTYKDKLPVVIVRISETYGPGDRRLLKLFKAVKKKMFFMIGPGKNLHHVIYIDDLVNGFMLAAESDKALGNTYVFSGNEVCTTNQMVEAVAEVVGSRLPPFRAPLWLFMFIATVMETVLRPLGIQPPLHRRRMDFFKKSFIFSQEYPEKQLGFKPKVSFREGAERTARWYEEEGML